ncbi:MAG TPA: hypothetical protein HA282_05270 [Nanoarchaeota archaeon]|nr:MAG: hypothetical protein QT01_C0001G0173 [archaeon GW2011_AR6]HIH17601.1 hypothetical protein [Nanoarchaeota archaeon]HIH33872.1 hypothetical protein [Nanoarchaeota archaeon]HIH51076.1 hypothetical protein [Nanoarchaeota archaeon]HIH66592.1 hypothetical protein [Nanoarchaeota archaeon]
MPQETKERLEKRLKREGWEFRERRSVRPSESIAYSTIPFGGGHLMMESQSSLTDEQLSREYEKDFADVLIADAYNAKGKVLRDMRDIYVKYRH